ncbi:hypothetical protein [Peptoniphilus phoceensis]|uniref:hypothetical protein n=1 Tax=Peptoniphilus phoceensis TaxID=1720298 RepID=UPI0007841EFD|nr:hypothetical protein [Peptoniphilus phoceensis]
MKRKFYTKIAFALLIMILLTSCKSKEKAAVENTSNGKEVSQENVNKEKNGKIEDKLFIEKENPRIVAMSIKAAKALKVLDYENVVGVPSGAESLYPDASSIGDEMDPDFKLVKNLTPELLLTDKSVTYDKALGQKVDDIAYASASFETLEDTKNGIMYFAKGLGLDEDATKEKIDSLTENI